MNSALGAFGNSLGMPYPVFGMRLLQRLTGQDARMNNTRVEELCTLKQKRVAIPQPTVCGTSLC